MPDLVTIVNLMLLIAGFGFVVFIHELGHFLAAKWVGIRVDQFAVGFGQALLCWRKGIGLTFGTSARRAEALRSQGRTDIGETEYRLNWIPLGGYVKMLGQDDMDPSAVSGDPRSYNRKSVGARMLVISAGVIMNVILAAVGFTSLFLIGYNTPAAVVGTIEGSSPAQLAGLKVGDRITEIDGKAISDFTKIPLAVALHDPTVPLPVKVQRADGSEQVLTVNPMAGDSNTGGLLQMGIGPAPLLSGLSTKDAARFTFDPQLLPASFGVIQPGEKIVSVDGVAVSPTDYGVFDAAVQTAASEGGRPVAIELDGGTGKRTATVVPQLTSDFLSRPITMPDGSTREIAAHILGMEMRAMVSSVQPNSSARGKLLPGDVVTEVVVSSTETVITNPSLPRLRSVLGSVGRDGGTIRLKVRRGDTEVDLGELTPNINLGQGRRGLGIGIGAESSTLIVGGVIPGSASERAGLVPGWEITAVNGTPVTNWFALRTALLAAGTEGKSAITIDGRLAGQQRQFVISPDEAAMKQIANMRFAHGLLLGERVERRQTSNVFTAIGWGVTETRDSIQQFYITIKRMVQGTVSYKNAMGPVGIFHTGTLIADRGYDWLLWFLCIISANLAVVNFLPIPIMDGGQFVFLMIEKLRGKPASIATQTAAQITGLVLLLAVFLLVTYQDIMRLF